jgi:hypothetical protein
MNMVNKICGLLLTLFFLCGILGAAPTAYANPEPQCGLCSITVDRDGDDWIVQWTYGQNLKNKPVEGTKVKINLYKNGKFLRTIADDVAIGKNGRGSYNLNAGSADNSMLKGEGYQIEVVSLTDSNLRVKSGKCTD